jgi:hypothetical protein
VPEISETYPGTSGSTHGDRNDSSPAIKAASGKGVADIVIILPCSKRDAEQAGSVTKESAAA